jgi:hypothetical protein
VVTTAEVDLSASKYTEALARAVAAQAVSLEPEVWEGLRALGRDVRTLRAVHRAVEAEGECMCGGAGVPPCYCPGPCIVMRLTLEPRQCVRGRGEGVDLSMLWLMERWLCTANTGPSAGADPTLPLGGAQAIRTASTASSRHIATPW